MKRTKKVYHPYNFVSTVNYDEFPAENLISLGAPGIFTKRLSRKTHINIVEKEADAIYIADPDGKKLKQRSTVVLENLSKKIELEKGNIIGEYVKHAHLQTGLPVFPVVASKYNNVTPEKYYQIDPRIYMNPFLLNLDEKYNKKKLNNVKNKLKSNNELSIETGMDLCNAILYAPPNHEVEVLYEAVDYYLKFKIENPRLRFALYTSFYCMTDAYIDDEKDFEELIEMINKKQTPEVLDEFNTLLDRENKLAQARKIIAEKDNELAKKDSEINKKDNELAKKDSEIAKNKETFSEIKKLVDTDLDIDKLAEINKILLSNVPN